MRRLHPLAWLALFSLSNVVLGQTGLKTPLQLTVINGINSTWPGEGGGGCSSAVINNQSTVSRSNNYHSIQLSTGTGTWSATINYSDTSCSGPWSSFGSAAQINQSSSPAVGYGNGYHPWIQVVVTGNAVVSYAAQNQLGLSTASGSVSFPISIAQGGTNGTTSATGLANLLNGNAQGTYTNKVQMAGTNSGTTGAPLCDDSSGNATTSGCSPTLPTGSQNQFLRIQPSIASNTTYQWASLPTANPLDYGAWTLTPAANLTAGSNATITLAFSPLGLAWNDTNHYVRITDSIGGNENQVHILTAGPGNCTSGQITSCTITLDGSTLAHNHTSGNWSIVTATQGCQETENAAGSTGVHMLYPAFSGTVYATCYLPNSTWIQGASEYDSIVNVDSSMTAVDVYHFTGTYGNVSSLEILYPSGFNPSAGSAIFTSNHEAELSFLLISGTDTYGPRIGINCFGCGLITAHDVDIYEPKIYGVNTDTNDGAYIGGYYYSRVYTTCNDPNQCSAGFFFHGSWETGTMADCATEGGVNAVQVLEDASGQGFSDNKFIGNVIDNAGSNGFYFQCTFASATCGFDRNQILFNQIACANGTCNGINIAPGASGLADDFDIIGNAPISYSGSQGGIVAQNLQKSHIAQNSISSVDNSAGTGINLNTTASSHIQIVGNDFLPFPTVGTTCSSQSINLDNQSHVDIFVGGGNKMCGSGASGAIANANTTGALTVTSDNLITNGFPTIASASTLAVSAYPLFYVSGTTAITAFSQLASGQPRDFTLIWTNASPGAVTACRSASFTPVQYVPVIVHWDGTNAYCK